MKIKIKDAKFIFDETGLTVKVNNNYTLEELEQKLINYLYNFDLKYEKNDIKLLEILKEQSKIYTDNINFNDYFANKKRLLVSNLVVF